MEVTELGDGSQVPSERLAVNTFLHVKAECRRLWKVGGEEVIVIESQEFLEMPLGYFRIWEDNLPLRLVVAALPACVMASSTHLPDLTGYVLQPAKERFPVTVKWAMEKTLGVLCASRPFLLFLYTFNPTPNIHTSHLLDERVKMPRYCSSIEVWLLPGFSTLFKGTVPYIVPYLQWVPWRTHDPQTWRCILHFYKDILFLCIMTCPCVSHQGHMIVCPLLQHFKEM